MTRADDNNETESTMTETARAELRRRLIAVHPTDELQRRLAAARAATNRAAAA